MLYTDALVSTTYDAAVAGLSWALAPSADGIKLTVSGYSDKLLLLLQKVRAGCTPRVHARVTEVSPLSRNAAAWRFERPCSDGLTSRSESFPFCPLPPSCCSSSACAAL